MAMEYNTSPISLREAKVMLDGLVVADAVKATIKFTPDVWSGKQLGERTPSSRWLGGKITGNITRRRSTPFLKEKVMEYLKSGKTPELTIQGIMNDKESDFYAAYGSDVVTVVGCVLTGDFNLSSFDSEGEVLDDVISFNGKNFV